MPPLAPVLPLLAAAMPSEARGSFLVLGQCGLGARVAMFVGGQLD